MLQKIADLIGKFQLDYLMYACLGILVVIFIFGLILSLATGDANKFKSLAKFTLKNPTLASFQSTASKMPVKVKKQYKEAKISGAKPSDVITIDACVNAPFSSSVAARFGTAVMATSIFVIALMFAIGFLTKDAVLMQTYAATAVVIAAGMVLRLLAGLISMGIQSSCMKTYNKYVDKLDELVRGGSNESTVQPRMQADEEITEMQIPEMNVVSEPQSEPMTMPVTDESPVAEPMPGGFDEPTRITVELAEEEPMAMPYEAPVVMPNAEEERARAREEAIAAAREEQLRAQAEIAAKQREEHQREQADALAKQREQAAARMQAAQAARAAQAAQTQQAAHAAQAPGAASSADDVIARIEKINREGAPLATMKEVALLLQQERAKPENKTPEQQKKLNEALVSLLKTMSAANKR